ncbi:MAG: hypothetical protein B6I30_07240 [Desulfobacteraceae bacterium 4572_187]|nr:MAG: hypothetical protein B6I30_07240 [Desulfobacteraceae bacterium 4572_187]
MAKRSYSKEIEALPKTVKWAFKEPILASFENLISDLSSYPLLVVGSGGSLSCAHFVAQLHEQKTGFISRALTPLEMTFSGINPLRHSVLFLTSTGNNKDILSAFDMAIKREFPAIAIICATTNSRIVKIAKKYPYVQIAEFRNPAGRDGFLAVNSLLSTCILSARAYNAIDLSEDELELLIKNDPDLDTFEWHKVLDRKTMIAVSGEWGLPALIDLESNLKSLASKTMIYLPDKYPSAVLHTNLTGPLGGIDLLKQVFQLVGKVGKLVDIDPGMPKVPEFGRKIYSIGLTPVLPKRKTTNKVAWLQRKSRVSGESVAVLEKHLDKFFTALKHNNFFGVVFDYDGTLCDPPDRFTQPKTEIALHLNEILSKEIPVGIAAGRGASIQKSLRAVIGREHWDKIIIGNYNGSYVLPLSKDISITSNNSSDSITVVSEVLKKDVMLRESTNIEVRPKQITVTPKPRLNLSIVLEKVFESLSSVKNVKILRSDHSVDIIDSNTSKLNVVKEMQKILPQKKSNILIIGDQGQYGGNDFEMLKEPFSLSVNKISSSPTTCWNLSPAGIQGADAMISIFKSMVIKEKAFKLNIDFLEHEVGG